jgi:hypothetical protein
MLTFTDPDTDLHYRVTVRNMRIRDGIALSRDRETIAELHKDDPTLMLSLFNLPLLRHGSTLEISPDGTAWQSTILTEEMFLDLNENFAGQWLDLVMAANPMYGFNQIEALKKNLSSLLGNESSLENLSSAAPADVPS